MEIKFEKKYLEELFYTGKTTDKKRRFQPRELWQIYNLGLTSRIRVKY
jgi:hypothetical protein